MSSKQIYRRMLEEGFVECCPDDASKPDARLAYLSTEIFNLTTYDDEMDALFGRKACEVVEAINNRRTFDFIKDADQYRWYLIMCNMPFFADRLEWGTSIRGAWWGPSPGKNCIEFSSCGIWLDGEQLHELMKFPIEEWQQFVAAILDFSRNASVGS